MNSANLCTLAGRYDNPIPPRFLAPIGFLKIPALLSFHRREIIPYLEYQSSVPSPELAPPLPQASVSPPGTKGGGGHPLLADEGAGGANSDDGRKAWHSVYSILFSKFSKTTFFRLILVFTSCDDKELIRYRPGSAAIIYPDK
jgi:hypothetical protein